MEASETVRYYTQNYVMFQPKVSNNSVEINEPLSSHELRKRAVKEEAPMIERVTHVYWVLY